MFLAAPAWSATAPIIFSAVVNATNNRITINGANFSPFGLAPTVAFAHTALAAYSERWRSAFRGDGDHDSELMPIAIPR
jgi:hypothetical protein